MSFLLHPTLSPSILRSFPRPVAQNIFVRALKSLDQSAMVSSLQVEFATLCNTLVAADNKKIRVRAELGDIVRKACGYIGLGLSRASGIKKEPSLQQAHESIQQILNAESLTGLRWRTHP